MPFIEFMIENYKVITFTHHLVDISLIGRYQVKEEEGENRIQKIVRSLGIDEMMYLSTCNRVCYIFTTHQMVDIPYIHRLMLKVNPGLNEEALIEMDTHLSLYEGIEAVQHVFEVAGSIDSLVVGESEIFRQFRKSYSEAQEAGLIGENLKVLEKVAVQVAKRIYSHTRINEKPLSIAALAGQAIMEKEERNTGKVVFVGAGETNTLVAKFLLKHGYELMDVYNRTLSNAGTLAEITGGKAYDLDALQQGIKFDVLVVCTAAQNAVIDAHLYQRMIGSDDKCKILVDLSVPSNIDPFIAKDFNAQYINIEELRVLAEKNLNFRRQEIVIAKSIIEEALEEFKKVYGQRQIELAMSDLPVEIRKIKEKITNEVFHHKIETFSEEQREILAEILNYMEAKCIGIPMKLAKKTVN